MTEAQKELYTKTKEHLRQLGKENPADAILYLAMVAKAYRSTITMLEVELDKYKVINKLLEGDIADRDKMLEQKVEEVYADFMRDYKCMREELDGTYEELAELKTKYDTLGDALLSEKAKKCDAVERLTPQKPAEETDDFGDRSVCCPHCIGPVTNYWAPGTKPKHCQFCGQALDWGEEGEG